MSNTDFVNVKVEISGKIRTIKMEKGCSFDAGNKRYSINANGEISIFNKTTYRTTTSERISMTNYQFATFKAVANNTDEGLGNKWTLSIADIKSAMNKFKNNKLAKDLHEFLSNTYKVKNTKLFSTENKFSAYITNGNAKTSSVIAFQFSNITPKDKTDETAPSASSGKESGNGLFSNPNIITEKAFTHTTKAGESIVDLARKYEVDTYQIIAANPQLKEGRDYKVTYSKSDLANIKCNFKPGTKITIPARYKVKKGSCKNLADVAKITGVSENYLKDLLTIVETRKPGVPDLTTYDDCIPSKGKGTPTIGFGHTGRVDGKPLSYAPGKKITITKEKAYEILAEDILKHEAMTIAYMGKKNWQKTPDSVKSAILDITYNKGIWDGFKNPHWNKYTKKIKKNLQDGHYASALCNTYRQSGVASLLERNIYRFISGLKDLPPSKRKAAIKAFEPRYQKALKAMKKKKSLRANVKLVQKAWANAKKGIVTGYKMKSSQ